VHISEGACDGAGHALHALFVVDEHHARFFVSGDGIDWADLNTGCVIALEAKHGHVFVFADGQGKTACLPWLALASMGEGTGHFASSAADAVLRLNDESLGHPFTSCCIPS
jgi:hypothetical protein